jgi:L-rhamnose isomerase
LRLLCEEIVRSRRLPSIHIGLDFFDGTLNRIGAWTIGARAMLKGLLCALLQPRSRLMAAEERGDFFERLALLEETKTMPFGAVWDFYCARSGAPTEDQTISRVHEYGRTVLAARE